MHKLGIAHVYAPLLRF